MMMLRLAATFVIGLTIAVPAAAPLRAEDVVTYETTLKGAAFTVAEIKVPAGRPFIIKMTNANPAPAELEAKELKIEKAAAGNSTIVVRVKAMEPGKYLFVDEYQEDAAKGYVVVE
jgi:heme/copper-type cytochrome/quinol oxidase subunit 2